MCALAPSDQLLVTRIRGGEPDAWNELIARFEGRLLAFVEGRLGRRTAGEDVVQETFLGFLNSLPNFEDSRPLESYLFSIAAHKLTDHLRREGRRPTLPMAVGQLEQPVGAAGQWPGRVQRDAQRRAANSMEEDAHRRGAGRTARPAAQPRRMAEAGLPGAAVRARLGQSRRGRQAGHVRAAVANFKFEFISRLRTLVRKQGLSEDVFPELHEERVTPYHGPHAHPSRPGSLSGRGPAGRRDGGDRASACATTQRWRSGWRRSTAAATRAALAGRNLAPPSAELPLREQLGSYLLGVLDKDEAELRQVSPGSLRLPHLPGQSRRPEDAASRRASRVDSRRKKYFQSSAGHLPAAGDRTIRSAEPRD